MSRRRLLAIGVAFLVAAAVAEPASALATEPPDLPALEQAWHSCVREAFDQQPMSMSKLGRERNALDACQPHEDAYVIALMASRSIDTNPLPWPRQSRV
jgi:hypothetical protein